MQQKLLEVKQVTRRNISMFFDLISLLGILVIVGCGNSGTPVTLSSDPTTKLIPLEALPTPQPRPSFIRDISPPESSIVSLDLYRANLDEGTAYEGVRFEDCGYNTSICVVVDMGALLQKGDRLAEWRDILDRISVSVDDNHLTETTYVNWLDYAVYTKDIDGGAGYIVTHTTNALGAAWTVFCWYADVDVGNHEVVFEFRQTSGEIQEHRWHFAITDGTVAPSKYDP